MAIIGIDLGTTNSLAAFYQANGPVIIPNVYGEHLTPSVVSVDTNGEVFVGSIAKERLVTHPTLTASVFKRSMGSKKEYNLGGKIYSSEELSSLVIKKLKEDAEIFLGETVEEAVVSVPAYFNDTQRRATQTAGRLAGLKVERIVNEPTAAAVAYGLHDRQDYTKYLVFDLGGGTFDVSILEKYKNIMEVRAVAGDNFLGGEDFSNVLLEMFAKHHGLVLNDLPFSAQAMLRKSAETAKRGFSDARHVTMRCTLDEQPLSMDITLNEYEKQCETLMTRLRNPIRRALADASIHLSDIDSILLVGGATRLPLIKNFVSRLMGRFPSADIHPDEVVALGAAVHSALKSRNVAITEIVLTDVCPFTLGTNTAIYKSNGFYESGHFCPIIERNSVIPVSRTERFHTVHDNQKNITIEILQGESRRSNENVMLGELNIPIPPAKAGKESVDVRYTYDVNGILEVEVTVVSTQVRKTVVIEKNPGVMTPAEIQQKLKELESIKIHPRDKDEYRLLLERAERMYQESVGDVRRFLAREIQAFEALLDRQDERAIRTYAEKFRETLDEIDNNLEY